MLAVNDNIIIATGAGTNNVVYTNVLTSSTGSSWSVLSSGITGFSMASAVFGNNHIYYSGGVDNSGTNVNKYIYRSQSSFSSPAVYASVVLKLAYHSTVIYDSKLIIVGGISSATVYNTRQQYFQMNTDGSLQSLGQVNTVPVAIQRVEIGLVVFQNKLLLAGGSNGATVFDSVYWVNNNHNKY
jgi:hypothetical protein